MSAIERWDVFCRVVDHYGDIGIAWRLAKQLNEASCAVRLFVDDLVSFARIEPRVDAASAAQRVDGIDIRRWPIDDAIDPADVVVELLGCRLPDRYLDAMARRETKPVWIDFEHLSAEAWVDGFHGLPSPHPVLPLVKHFFYPGFDERTGGLLIERDVDARRAAFVADTGAVDTWRRRIGLERRHDVRRVSLFAYDDAPLDTLFDALAADRDAWSIVVPHGVLTAAIEHWFDGRPSSGLTVTTIPFVDQDDYDRLLWTSDVNIVRGEDSFVRAQAAGRPFVWQAYRQHDAAHVPKLDAFVDRFDTTMPVAERPVVRRFWHAWNGAGPDAAAAVADWLAILPGQRVSADEWRRRVVSATPLIDRLLAFVADRRRSP